MTTGIMDEEVSHIPTPNQIPAPVHLQQIPGHVLRSGAIEALASQNEDLVARLSVALRRAALLENQIADLEHQQSVLNHHLNIAHDQVLVLQEKDRCLVEKTSAQESAANAILGQMQLLETQYAELYVTSRERVQRLSEKSDTLERENLRYFKYRKNLKRALKVFRQRARRDEEAMHELKNRLSEAVVRIQQMAKEADANQFQLVETYEQTLREAHERLADLERQNLAYAEKAKAFDELLDRSIVIENQLIEKTRAHNEHQATAAAESAQLQLDNSELRTQVKTQLMSLENLKNQVAYLNQVESVSRSEVKQLTDQVETLQLLWQEGQTKQEKLAVKNQAMQKLNQQLSTTINQQRHEIQRLRTQIESQNYSTSERIKEIKGHLQMMGQDRSEVAFIENTPPQQVISRIDTLIAEIQSGFRRQAEPMVEVGSTSSSSEDNLGSGDTAIP